MAVEKFNDTFLPNATVPQVGSMAGAPRPSIYDTRASATGMPSGVQSFDPTANMKADSKVLMASRSDTAGGSAKFKPKTVDSFADADVR